MSHLGGHGVDLSGGIPREHEEALKKVLAMMTGPALVEGQDATSMARRFEKTYNYEIVSYAKMRNDFNVDMQGHLKKQFFPYEESYKFGFHGTSIESAKALLEDPTLRTGAGRRFLWGCGVYVSVNWRQALYYAPPDAKNGFIQYVFVVQYLEGPMAVGTPHQVDFGRTDDNKQVLTLTDGKEMRVLKYENQGVPDILLGLRWKPRTEVVPATINTNMEKMVHPLIMKLLNSINVLVHAGAPKSEIIQANDLESTHLLMQQERDLFSKIEEMIKSLQAKTALLLDKITEKPAHLSRLMQHLHTFNSRLAKFGNQAIELKNSSAKMRILDKLQNLEKQVRIHETYLTKCEGEVQKTQGGKQLQLQEQSSAGGAASSSAGGAASSSAGGAASSSSGGVASSSAGGAASSSIGNGLLMLLAASSSLGDVASNAVSWREETNPTPPHKYFKVHERVKIVDCDKSFVNIKGKTGTIKYICRQGAFSAFWIFVELDDVEDSAYVTQVKQNLASAMQQQPFSLDGLRRHMYRAKVGHLQHIPEPNASSASEDGGDEDGAEGGPSQGGSSQKRKYIGDEGGSAAKKK